jgi:hypothetical protein
MPRNPKVVKVDFYRVRKVLPLENGDSSPSGPGFRSTKKGNPLYLTPRRPDRRLGNVCPDIKARMVASPSHYTHRFENNGQDEIFIMKLFLIYL